MAVEENVLTEKSSVRNALFSKHTAKGKLAHSFYHGLLHFLLKNRGWWNTLCHLPIASSTFLLYFCYSSCLCHAEDNLDSMSMLCRGCPKQPVSQRNVNCHISKNWKWRNGIIIAQKSVSLTLSFLFTLIEKFADILSAISSHFFSCVKSSSSSLIIFDTSYEAIFCEQDDQSSWGEEKVCHVYNLILKQTVQKHSTDYISNWKWSHCKFTSLLHQGLEILERI